MHFPSARIASRLRTLIACLMVLAASLGPVPTAAPAVHNGLAQAAATGLGWASPNWSGYAVTAGPYTSATGTWVVPAVAATITPTFSSTWVGIDGFANSSLIQVGTAQNSRDGEAFYSAWWEILPAVSQTITTVSVEPGDTIAATITQVTTDTWTITLVNRTTGAAFSTTQAYTGPGASAEWIQEAPTVAGRVTTLARYGSTTFTATANGRTPALALRNGGLMVQNGRHVSVPSVPDTATGRFTVHAAAVPGSAALTAKSLGTGKHGIRLTWTAAAPNGSPVVAYRVYRRVGATSTTRTLVATVGNALTWTDVKNPANRTSTYDVVAVNGVGPGRSSNLAGAYSR